ncbi:uncharacterized protein LOC103937991 [Pyrus x bretschneideri]|uniref:uncharacterized protein LOC103937991 n=1 Tax=Pyrus x bretschneideri TaxID=225117 RepID=UPI00202F901D|nr:uncharacterized protein LOC103937991 [Pyrus x bretschneideri]
MKNPHVPPPRPLYKQISWSPDTIREETWQRRTSISGTRRLVRSKSVSGDDLEELKACIELGFGFDLPDVDPKLSDTLPALEFYHDVNKQCSKSLLTDSGDAEEVKTRLRQWAKFVACSVRESSSSSI